MSGLLTGVDLLLAFLFCEHNLVWSAAAKSTHVGAACALELVAFLLKPDPTMRDAPLAEDPQSASRTQLMWF